MILKDLRLNLNEGVDECKGTIFISDQLNKNIYKDGNISRSSFEGLNTKFNMNKIDKLL